MERKCAVEVGGWGEKENREWEVHQEKRKKLG